MKKVGYFLVFLVFILVNLSFTQASVPDADKDGVPDANDKCPDSASNVVDSSGCDCTQKTASDCSGAWCCSNDNDACTDDCDDSGSQAVCNYVSICCDPVTQPSPHWKGKNGQCLPSCGHLGTLTGTLVSCSTASSCPDGTVSAGDSYDCNSCCKSDGGDGDEEEDLFWPIGCTFGVTCDSNIGYPDIDKDGKAFNCGEANIEGHEGTDIDISWEQMDQGIDVFAAADGEVLWVFDGKYDRCPNEDEPDCINPINDINPGESQGTTVCTPLGPYCGTGTGSCSWCFAGGNVVVIRHYNNPKIFATRYDHLKKGSIIIKEGDVVKKGQKIAEVGSAGDSSGPHLHFEVWGEKGFYKPVDPWAGPCGPKNSLWANQPDDDSNGDIVQNECKPLFPEHNDKDADRINIILIGSKYDNLEQFKMVAKKVLSLDGEVSIREVYEEDELVGNEVLWNMFSIEPFKSNKNKFNIWYLEEDLDSSDQTYLMDYAEERNNFKACDLDYIYPSILVNSKLTMASKPAHAAPSNFAGEVLINKEDIQFGSSVNSLLTTTNYLTFVHESGHALFGLADEYIYCTDSLYPNCATDQSSAEEFWGDLIGQVDPFYYEYKSTMEDMGEHNLIDIEDIRINYNSFTKYADLDDDGEEEAYSYIIPTKNSLMGNSMGPILGSVNRRRAEQVLDLFSGNNVEGLIIEKLGVTDDELEKLPTPCGGLKDGFDHLSCRASRFCKEEDYKTGFQAQWAPDNTGIVYCIKGSDVKDFYPTEADLEKKPGPGDCGGDEAEHNLCRAKRYCESLGLGYKTGFQTEWNPKANEVFCLKGKSVQAFDVNEDELKKLHCSGSKYQNLNCWADTYCQGEKDSKTGIKNEWKQVFCLKKVDDKLKCSDGTLHGSCSTNKPLFCKRNQLVNDCQKCGCSPGNECRADGSCVGNACIKLNYNGDPSQKLDFVIVGHGFSNIDLNKFVEASIRVKNKLLSYEPFKSNNNKINFYRIDAPLDLGCYYNCNGIARLICCDTSRIDLETVHCPHEQVMVIANSNQLGGAGYSWLPVGYAIAHNGNSKNPPVYEGVPYFDPQYYGDMSMTHEIGHTFGKLYDEYSYGPFPGENEKWYLSGNCDPTPGCPLWGGTPGTGCFQGCTYDEWYRPVESNSMMLDKGGDFNPVGTTKLTRLMEAYS